MACSARGRFSGRANATRSSSGFSRGSGAGSSLMWATSTSAPTTATTSACCLTRRSSFLSPGDHSRINGFTGRVNLVEHGGFSAFVVMAHTNAIFSPPGVGGVLLEQPGGDFRIDHDQKFNSTTNVQYVFYKPAGAWAALSWRYDSGLVAGAVGSLEDALGLTADQQAAIGFNCGGVFASLGRQLTDADCTPTNYGAARLRIPAEGTADDVNNPPRVAPRHLLDLGFGADNLLHGNRAKVRMRLGVLSVTDKEGPYYLPRTF